METNFSSDGYELNLEVCPESILGRAVLIRGKWVENSYSLMKHLSDDHETITLFIQGYDGTSIEKAEEWSFDCPTSRILESAVGTWLYPLSLDGNIISSLNEGAATWGILHLAEEIWNKTHKAPNIEAIRLDDPERKKLRLYSFWFPFRGHEPLVESQPIYI